MNATGDLLPWPWETKQSSKTGHTYYYNRSTGESTWQHPLQNQHMQSTQPRASHGNGLTRPASGHHASDGGWRQSESGWHEQAHRHASPQHSRQQSAGPFRTPPRNPRATAPDPGSIGAADADGRRTWASVRGHSHAGPAHDPRRPATERGGGGGGGGGGVWDYGRERGGRLPFGAAGIAPQSHASSEIARLQARPSHCRPCA